MLKPAWGLCCVLALVAAGCASGPRANAPDWQDSSIASVVPASPPLAPATAALPRQPQNGRPGGTQGSGQAASPARGLSENGSKWIPLQRWSTTTGAASLSRLASAGPATYALRSGQGTFVLQPGSHVAHLDGTEVRLGFPPQLINEQPYVHALDLGKTIVPLLSERFEKPLTEPILIDAGHGGDDAGAKGSAGSLNEKALTLDWAWRLKRSLAAKGVNALLTRAGDLGLPLSNRVAVATAARAGVFVSLHFNSAAPDEEEAGLETYCLTPSGMPSSLTRSSVDEVDQSFPNNAFDAENLQLALQVHRALLQVNGHRDRGVRRARFPTVLRGQRCPAVLIEGGYLSNPVEAQLISDAAYRQRLADAVASALAASLRRNGDL